MATFLSWFFHWFDSIFRVLGVCFILAFWIAVFLEILKRLEKYTRLKFVKKGKARGSESDSQNDTEVRSEQQPSDPDGDRSGRHSYDGDTVR